MVGEVSCRAGAYPHPWVVYLEGLDGNVVRQSCQKGLQDFCMRNRIESSAFKRVLCLFASPVRSIHARKRAGPG